jgi:hypothetical protein
MTIKIRFGQQLTKERVWPEDDTKKASWSWPERTGLGDGGKIQLRTADSCVVAPKNFSAA